MLSGIGQFIIRNYCSSIAISVRLQPDWNRGATTRKGENETSVLNASQHWTARYKNGESPAVCACLANGGTRGVMRTVIQPSPEICPRRGCVANKAEANRKQRHRAGLRPF
jgi:hypothetical protein